MALAEQRVGLEAVGIEGTARVYWSVGPAALYEEAVRRREGMIAADGPLVCSTGQHTGRSPNDKFIVKEPSSETNVAWGRVNRPIDAAAFDGLERRMLAYLRGKELFVQDCWAGADPAYRLPIRVITEKAWHSLFARHLFIPETDRARLRDHAPRVHGHRRAEFHRRSSRRPHEFGSLHPAQFRQASGADWRDQLRRRDQEVDLHRDELPAAASRRDADALLGEHRAGGRRRAVLRSVGHRQDDALERARTGSSSATTSTGGAAAACSTSRAAATRR